MVNQVRGSRGLVWNKIAEMTFLARNDNTRPRAIPMEMGRSMGRKKERETWHCCAPKAKRLLDPTDQGEIPGGKQRRRTFEQSSFPMA